MVESADSGQHAPGPVKNAVSLLRLQAAIWAMLSAGIVADGSANLALTPTSKVRTAFAVAIVLALAMGTFAAAKFRLARRLPRGTHRTREAVITVETLMAGFAGLVTLVLAVSVFGLILSPPFIIGGIMSARVARGLARPPARQYFDANQSAGACPATLRSPRGGGQAQFRGHLATA